ncbi:hypothetical protein LOTGIDRAFT_229063 [Lottia gigantea]|uniref:AAA+ ATPase domain-containing protein n=2 Tax=Lottia gigantea TaxID=225164 RepID=V4A786_LOTGI|nr:hypothetical protein LOTGIDRAFT_229063 [Lottia gigantea]ESO89151.1 hypothetical protein LOTGIDRAFT_229063 [Lottia gigantea]
MDERHWWIAGKIQESFKIGGYDNPTLLEDFMCEETTLSLINKFLRSGGPCRLFFYCERPENGLLSTRELHSTGNLAALKDVELDSVTILYFLRNKTEKDVDPSRMERDIFCGELKHNTIETLNTLLSDIYIPLIRAQKDWGQCNEEGQSNLIQNMDKFVTALNETTASMHSSKQLMLKLPENIVLNDFKLQRAAALDSQIIGDYEELVTDWMNTIETIIVDTSDERFMDPNAGPLSELERWRRRQRLLTSLTEQLKSKECKAVIGVLITAKSRLLRRWKIIDVGITDAMNDTKDKVKYLESLRRHFDQLYNDATPHSIMNTAIPGLTNSIKQMESISRYYGRVGFLGIVLAKVTNQIVLACKEHIKECTMNIVEDEDYLWKKVSTEINRDNLNMTDPQQKLLRSQIESKLKGARSKGKESKDIGVIDKSLYGRLRSCLTLQSFYREALRSLRDSLGNVTNLSHFSSVSSFVGASLMSSRSKQTTATSMSRPTLSPSKKTLSLFGDNVGHGVPLTDEDAILSHFDSFCGRIRQLLDVMNTMSQYSRMVSVSTGIPRPRKEDLVIEEPEQDEKYRYKKEAQEKKAQELKEEYSKTPVLDLNIDRNQLGAIAEDEETIDDDKKEEEGKKISHNDHGDEIFDVVNTKNGLTEEELAIIRRYYNEDDEDEGPSISSIIEEQVSNMTKSMSENVTTKTLLDVESKDKEKFDHHYNSYINIVQELEKFLAAYMHAIFVRKMKTQQGLEIITKFAPIQSRPGIRGTISDKFVEVFNWYESDLEDVQKIYEKNKDHPLTVRNAPPVAGAIYWSRQLLKRIEDPMKVFRDIKAVTQLTEYGRIVRIYNRLATALVTFESLWFTQWKNRIDLAKSGLRATLFVYHPDTNEVVVNSDERVLELIHEAKWLTRLDIQIPESAMNIMQQEERFKSYKGHLELVLNEYRSVCESIPESLRDLFTPHIENVQQQLQPGLNTLAWNSMNIDAFLHQIHTATSKLQNLEEKVNELMDNKVLGVIGTISQFYLYDSQLAFSQTWSPVEFRDKMLEGIEDRSQQLHQYVQTVVEGLQSVANLLSTKKKINGTDSKKKGESGRNKDKKMMLIIDEEEVQREKEKAVLEEALVYKLIAYYHDQVYEAVLSSVCRSLSTLADASGCTVEQLRPITPGSTFSSEGTISPRPGSRRDTPYSRLGSALSDRPDTGMSMLSNMTWSGDSKDPSEVTHLQFEIQVKFNIPNIIVEPELNVVQKAITDVSNAIMQANKNISWLGSHGDEEFYPEISTDDTVIQLQQQLSSVIEELENYVHKHLYHFSYYNFLWKDDMHGNFHEFIAADPGIVAIKREVERFLSIEKKVLNIPTILPVGSVCLYTDPIKDALHGFAMAWKTKFATVLHEEAKKKLDSAVSYRENVKKRLEQFVQSLDQLNSSLHLLEDLRDMENKIDAVYLPIETMYSKLREFELRLPRNEVEQVDELREKWQELIELADQVREVLLKERRGAFEQELDKQVKTFVVEVIQFRNAFDAQGPAVPGIPPAEAVSRLQDFQNRYTQYDAKRKTLDSVSKLFGIPCKPFPELDKTGEELDLLSQLYGLFQKFIKFDNKFRDTLWADVDLEAASMETETYWDECLALPSKLKDWDAYNDLKTKLQTYLEVFPLLHNLASKKKDEHFQLTEIRNRHWLQVMQVTGSSFQLEANVFKLCHLLDIELIKYKSEIEDICRGASRELELEIKMRQTEEEWTEQVLNFEHYKKRGPMYLDKAFTERLLEQLEDAQALLAGMLTSRYIGPLRDEAASWAEKLKEVAEVLELWLEVQDVWQYLEAVFSNSLAVKELPQEAKRFSRIDKGWTKMMKRAFDTRNVLQCCYGGEVPKGVVLRHMQEELEICFKSLVIYLDNKRKAFPRFYFVSDTILLSILSRPNDLESVRPHLRSIFSQIHDVKLEKCGDNNNDDDSDEVLSSGRKTSPRTRTPSIISPLSARTNTPPKIDKRLAQVHSLNPASLQNIPTMLPSEGLVDDVIIMDAKAVHSSDGETLILQDQVTLTDGVESWLYKLKESVGKTLHQMNLSIINDCNSGIAMDEWASKYPAQVCRMGMLYHWTKECETGISEVKYDRKALQGTLRKYVSHTSKLSSILSRGAWKGIDEAMLPVHKGRLECMVAQSLFLRDILENLSSRKLREVTDFEWRRSIRCYLHPVDDKPEPLIWILDNSYDYGNEFYGSDIGVALTPLTERCFLTMSQALKQYHGSSITGPVGVGKTETVKGLANILGNFLGMFHCSTTFNPGSLGKIVQGLAMDGCWGCFDEAQNLNSEAIAVLMECAQKVLLSLRSSILTTSLMEGQDSYGRTGCKYTVLSLRSSILTTSLMEGQDIYIKTTVGLFMTVNPDVTPPRCSLPNELRSSFRTVSLIRPDIGQILKCKCSALGFRAPGILANRLKVLSELVKDQLPHEFHYHFTISSLVGVLKRACQKRRYLRDEKSTEKDKREESRSESVASEATVKLNMPLQSSGPSGMGSLAKLPGQAQTRKAGTPNPMTAAGKLDHSVVCNTIEEVLGPRMTATDLAQFKVILKEVFNGLPEVPTTRNVLSAKSRGFDLEVALENKAADSGLIATKPWINRCVQLHNLSQVSNGIIVAGAPGSGKSTCIQTLVDALCVQPRGLSRQSHISNRSNTSKPIETNHKLLRINPLVVDDSSLMFGYLNQNNDWVDGIFTSACKKANRNMSTTWLCLDGPLIPSWADNFNSVLAGEKVLHLKNGDKLFLSDNVILLFETDSLCDSSPSTIARTGIVYLDKDVVGWKPIAKAWLENRTQQEAHVLQRAFQKCLDPIINFVFHDCKPKLKLCEVGLFKTCLGLLSAMLADNIEIGGEMHIERMFLFCLIWTFGGLLDQHDRKAFSDLLKTLSSALPDDDHDISVFDYYVDESGEWDPWHSRVPEAVFVDNQDMLGEVFIDSVNSIRTRILMEFAAASGQNVLLVGPHGSGKTSLINEFIDLQDQQTTICKRLVFSGASTASQLQQFIESNIYHRQGFVYGARDNKKLRVFIDDVNLPVPDDYNVQRSNELLRQLLDEKVLCTLQKPFEWRSIEGLTVLSGMALSDYPGFNNRTISERLLRHFAVFHLPAPQDEALKSIVNGILDSNMTDQDATGLDLDLHNGLVQASCELLTEIQSVLRPTPMPGRYHYLFTLKDITKCFQCLQRLADESKADDLMVISLWKHETQRIMRDRICRTSDLNWFDDKLDKLIEKIFPKLEGNLHEHFVTFPIDSRMYQRPMTSAPSKQIKVNLQPIDKLSDIHTCLNSHLTRYNEEFGNVRLDIMLSDYVIAHVVKMHRILSFHHGGNMLLIGAVGCHLSTLCKLALHVANIGIHKVDNSKQSSFFDGLRSAVRMSGSENKIITLLFTSRDLSEPVYLDAINSLLISGEYPHLFSNDEMEGLLQAIHPAMKREFPTMSVDPMKYFVSRVKCNLHIILCLPPNYTLLQSASELYPGILNGCQSIWMCDWPHEGLMGEASYFITKHQLTEEFENLSVGVTSCLANIHSFVLRDCKQMPWAGELGPDINMTMFRVNEKKKDQLKLSTVKVPNLPYSKLILQERIKLNHRDNENPGKNEVYVGPTTYRRFKESFRWLYNIKSKERTQVVEQLKKVLGTLDQTRVDSKIMKKAIKSTNVKFDDARKNTANLLHQLTMKATVLEKLKAKVGLSKSLNAYLHLTELEADEIEEDELLKQEEYDDYDAEFDKMREANLKTRHIQAKEEYTLAVKAVEDCKHRLEHSKSQVTEWKNKIDRSCIETIRSMSNPPMLVGQVMEMVMTLIGKRLPSQRIVEVREHTGKEDMSSRISSSSSSTKHLVKKSKQKEGERFDRSVWKGMLLTMSDSVKFVDMVRNVPWEDGLPEDVLRAVESYLAISKDGQLGVYGDASMLDTSDKHKRTPSPDGRQAGITIAAAKYSNEDCATLVNYSIAIVEYCRLCSPLKAAKERQQELAREIEENERKQRQQEEEPENDDQPNAVDENLTEDDLPRIQEEENGLQRKFDEAVMEKHSLEMELQSMNERLKAATELVESLKGQEEEWRQYVKDNDSNELLLANCLTAAAFLTYCGATNIDTRKRMGEFSMQVCEHHGLPLHKQLLFKNIELIDFLYTPLDEMELKIMQLPTTQLMLENSCFLMQEETTTAWPLICDPTSRVIEWLKLRFQSKGLVEVKYHALRSQELRSQLDNCLSEGIPLLVTDCDVVALKTDKRFHDTIQNCRQFTSGKTRFKVIVEDHEVECEPGFRLYLHTTVEPHVVPQKLAAYTSVLYYQQSRYCVEEELLDTFMKHEKSRLENERIQLRQEKFENMKLLDRLEKQMKDLLSSDIVLLKDLQSTKRLADFKKQFDETLESQYRIDISVESIRKAREGFRSIAQRAAVCFDTTQYMREINPLYQISFKQYLSLYEGAISHSERSAIKAVIEKITSSSFFSTARGLLEKDRQIYALLLAIEVEESHGHVGPGEREFIISPNFGSVVMSAFTAGHSVDSKVLQAKKPFDWMTDDQFHNLQVLASHFDWFQEMFDRMPKDGRETQWRNLCESDNPETVPLPDKMDEFFKPIQRLCIIRAIRSDRLLQASTLFIQNVLGKKFFGEIPLDLPSLLRQSSTSIPIILLFSFEGDLASKLFTDFANRKQAKSIVINLTDYSPATDKYVKKQIQKAMAEGSWILLHNAHNAGGLLLIIEQLLSEGSQQCDQQFRLWISSQTTPQIIPNRLLQQSVKTVIDTPKTMRDSLVRSFASLDYDVLKQGNRAEWPIILHNLCYLHATIQLRARFGQGGWNCPQDFKQIGFIELQEGLRFTASEFKDPIVSVGADGSNVTRSTSWTGARYILSEVLYGSHITDSYDQQSLCAIVDYWLSPQAIKKDFEVARLKYRVPSAFFNTNVRLNTLIQALDGINHHYLDVPEACHLHPNVETLLGDDQYIFTRLNKIFDAMPSSPTLTHKLFPRPPTPFKGPPLAGISSQSNNPSVVGQGVFATASYATFKMRKDVELWEICHTMLSKVPKAYTKEFINDKLKKIGGFTPFNNFIVRELETMYKLLTEIKGSMQAIKLATETNILGDQVSNHILSVADDLYHFRIPQIWCDMSGVSAPPLTWGLGQWLTELQNRCYHFEKILTLGREKMPAYWLGAFFNPRGLLSLLKQEYTKQFSGERSGNFEQFTFQTEVTSRDKDHLRDPPHEGMFIYGIYMWGCAWEKTTGELQDAPPRTSCATLPVVHLTCLPVTEKHGAQDSTKSYETYQCPVYNSRIASRDPVMEMDVRREGVAASRWALRGLSATIRPY